MPAVTLAEIQLYQDAIAYTGLAILLVLKLISVRLDPDFSPKVKFLFLSPLPATRTWKENTRLSWKGGLSVATKALLSGVLFGFSHLFAASILRHYGWAPDWQVCWIFVPFSYFGAEFLSRVANLICSISGYLTSDMQRNPILARNLSEFWSQRWNRHFSDWFKQVLFNRLKWRTSSKILFIFLISGIMHDVLINVPFYFVLERNYLGSMTLYFLLNGIGVILDRKIFHGHSLPRRAFFFATVLGPLPLFYNTTLVEWSNQLVPFKRLFGNFLA